MICFLKITHYYWLIFFENFRIKNVPKFTKQALQNFFQLQDQQGKQLKKTTVGLELLKYIQMVEKGIRGGICPSINRYAKTNNKYIKDHDKNKE